MMSTPEAAPSQRSTTIDARRIPLSHTAIVRAPGLLPMLYRPAELAAELEVSVAVVREWMDKGLPFQRDQRGHIWLDGRQAAEWVTTTRQRPSKSKLAEDQAYCLRCNRIVELRNPVVTRQQGKHILLSGTCPQCGGTINRGSRNG